MFAEFLSGSQLQSICSFKNKFSRKERDDFLVMDLANQEDQNDLWATKLLEGSPEAALEKEKASVRAKVEHAFFYIKRMFGYNKVRYRGLEKNANRLYLLAGFTNLLRAERYMAT